VLTRRALGHRWARPAVGTLALIVTIGSIIITVVCMRNFNKGLFSNQGQSSNRPREIHLVAVGSTVTPSAELEMEVVKA